MTLTACVKLMIISLETVLALFVTLLRKLSQVVDGVSVELLVAPSEVPNVSELPLLPTTWPSPLYVVSTEAPVMVTQLAQPSKPSM